MSLKIRLKNNPLSTLAISLLNKVVSPATDRYALVFMLHRFSDPERGVVGHSPLFIDACLQELRRRRYNLISVDELVQARLAGERLTRTIAFTIDDGYYDQADVGAEIFLKYDCPVTIYLITDFIDGNYWPIDARIEHIIEATRHASIDLSSLGHEIAVDLSTGAGKAKFSRQLRWLLKEKTVSAANRELTELAEHLEVDLSVLPGKFAPVSWDRAAALEKRGVSFGPHTCSHPVLSNEMVESAEYEIRQSIAVLRSRLQNSSKVFCYPTGRYSDFSAREMALVARHGGIAALAAEPGYVGPDAFENQKYRLPRFSMPSNMFDFQQCVLHIELFKQFAAKLK